MSQSLWDILGERIGDINPSLLSSLVKTYNNPEDRIEAILRYADEGFCSVKISCQGTEHKWEVMPSCRKNMCRKLRKNGESRKSKTCKEEIEFIPRKYNFA